MKTVITITGIRPDFIRMSHVFKKLDQNFNHIMIHTGQHYDTYLSDAFFRDLNIREPDYQLSTGTSSKNHYEQLAYLSTEVIKCIKDNNLNPDLILFLGDSNTSAVSLPLKKEGYMIGHIEAGMRSYDRRMLEEINRTVCDICSDIFFVYHDQYKNNLLKENITRPIYVVGNTCVEPAKEILERYKIMDNPKRRNMILMDIHRPENFNYPNRLQNIFNFINALMEIWNIPVECLYFKRLVDSIEQNNINIGNVKMIPLKSFPDYLESVYHAKLLFSDSGTGQEEPALMNTPVIVPRDFTERPQSYEGNCSVKFDANRHEVKDQVQETITWVKNIEDGQLKMDINWLGDGQTSKLIIQHIVNFLL